MTRLPGGAFMVEAALRRGSGGSKTRTRAASTLMSSCSVTTGQFDAAELDRIELAYSVD